MKNPLQQQPATEALLGMYRSMYTAREIDRLEEQFTKRGEAFFHVSGAGHEGSVILGELLGPQDWLHCHYRDKALMLHRGISSEMFFHSLFCKDESHSRGRQMSAHLSAPELKVLSLAGPVGNSALPAVGVAAEVVNLPDEPVVLCSLGDGMTQEGEVLEAIAHAVRESLPVLFFIEDNVFAISTQTRGKTFFSLPDRDADEFYGLPLITIDGCEIHGAHERLSAVVSAMRKDRKPAIVIFKVERLANHTNADDQSVYRTPEEIRKVREQKDPLIRARALLLSQGIGEQSLLDLEEQIRLEVHQAAERSRRTPEPVSVHDAKAPLPPEYLETPEYRGNGNSLTMLEAIRETFRLRMEEDGRVTLFGEDLEDPKGDVFGITRGLSQRYPGRVQNSPLSESTIAGVTVGRAVAGGRPVGFIQFADFLPLAYNQIFAEMGSMYWRTDGGWQVPAILMITSGGYKPGLGPFHASSLEALAVHTPGVDVVMPSSAGDAAGLLNAAFKSGRPTLFFYPKNCLNDRDAMTSEDVQTHFVPLGKARKIREGRDITLLGYGNTVSLLKKAGAELDRLGVDAEIIDLRSLSPWDSSMVEESVRKTGHIIISHEDNRSAGFGAEILAHLSEVLSEPFKAQRVVRDDTYVPCNFGNQLEVLPSYKSILEAAVKMLGGNIEWDLSREIKEGQFLIEAIGSSPSDEMVTVIEYLVQPGDSVREGDLVASVEADKAVTEIASPMSGTVEELIVETGMEVPVGAPLIRLLSEDAPVPKPPTREEPGIPLVQLNMMARLNRTGTEAGGTGKPTDSVTAHATDNASVLDHVRSVRPVTGIVAVASSIGNRIVDNQEISRLCPTWSPEDIVKRTGIRRRPWADETQSVVQMAVVAAQKVLNQTGLSTADLGGLICSSGTPDMITPSLSCRILAQLAPDDGIEMSALDISAACSGYIYGLDAAVHQVETIGKPVLLITTELLSRRMDTSDPNTAPIFGDAATASIISSDSLQLKPVYAVEGSVTLASPDTTDSLTVPLEEGDPHKVITMDGPVVYQKAVRAMISSLEQSMEKAGVTLDELNLVVPHQANQRIINAVRQRLKLEKDQVFSNIESLGNTSSSTIPLCLEQILSEGKLPSPIGLTAFGGGYTYAASVLKRMT